MKGDSCKICFKDLNSPLFQIDNIVPSLFLSDSKELDELTFFDFSIWECSDCKLIQQKKLPNLDVLKPRFIWQRFREPEDHLDELANQIGAYFHEKSGAVIAGVSWQDTTLLGRLQKQGLQILTLDPYLDLGVPEHAKIFGIESIQASFSEECARGIVSRAGQVDGVVARDILEHAFDPVGFLKNLSILVKDEGIVVIEVPCSQNLLKERQYWLLWEHHISYFSQFTLDLTLRTAGFNPVWDTRLTLDAGEYLVIIAKKQTVSAAPARRIDLNVTAVLQSFEADYAVTFTKTRAKLRDLCNGGYKIFFYGANHVTSWWVQTFRAGEFLSGVIDDSPEKQGFFLPGTTVPIAGCAVLNSNSQAVCLHFFGVKTAARVLKKVPELFRREGIFMNAETFVREA